MAEFQFNKALSNSGSFLFFLHLLRLSHRGVGPLGHAVAVHVLEAVVDAARAEELGDGHHTAVADHLPGQAGRVARVAQAGVLAALERDAHVLEGAIQALGREGVKEGWEFSIGGSIDMGQGLKGAKKEENKSVTRNLERNKHFTED